MSKRSGSHIKDGALLAALLIAIYIIFHLTGIYENVYLSYLIYPLTVIDIVFFCLTVIAIVFFCLNYVKKRNGHASFSDVFAYGFKAICITALIMIVWNILAAKVIFPEHTLQLIEERRHELTDIGVPPEEIERQFNFSQKYFTVLTIGSTLFMHAIAGVVGALLGAALSKRNRSYQQKEIK